MARTDRLERAQTAVGVALVGCGVLLMCVAALQVRSVCCIVTVLAALHTLCFFRRFAVLCARVHVCTHDRVRVWQVPLEGSSVALEQQMNYAGWAGSAAIAARTQQLADEVEGGDEAAADTPATDEATTVADAASPMTMTVTSQPYATTVTQAQVVPTVQEEINRLESLVTATENKQLDEEGSMKTFKEQQLDKIEELKDKNARLKRRSVYLSSGYSILFAF
jgi:hypothetical protein